MIHSVNNTLWWVSSILIGLMLGVFSVLMGVYSTAVLLIVYLFLALLKNEGLIWYLIAFSIPLVIMRVEFGSLTVSLTIALYIVLIAVLILKFRSLRNNISLFDQLIIYGFFLWILLGITYSKHITNGIEYVFKLGILLILMHLTASSFFREKERQEKFYQLLLLSCGAYILFLSYIYLFVFKETYISVNTDFPTEENKNLLGFLLSIITPIAVSFIVNVVKNRTFLVKGNWLVITASFITIVGLVLTASRGAWVSVTISYLLVLTFNKRNRKVMFLLLLIVGLSLIFLSTDFQKERFLSIFLEDNKYYGSNSTDVRMDLNLFSLELFTRSPVIGLGTGSYEYFSNLNGYGKKPSHNEYLRVLVENGLVGFILFICVIANFCKKAFIISKATKEWYGQGISWSIFATTVYLLFINAFDNYLLWIFYGFILFYYTHFKKGRFDTLSA